MINYLRSLFTPVPVGFTTYVNTPDSAYSSPYANGSVGDLLSFEFILDESWNSLLTREGRNTEKVLGLSDLFGGNSIRLGVRKSVDGKSLVAVNYVHDKGVTTYEALRDQITAKPYVLKCGVNYSVLICKGIGCWCIQISDGTHTANQNVVISISSFMRRVLGVYIEQCPTTITTFINIIKR
jgi:hypothetical protein